ncbi:MAG TPA: hypothetical protein VJS64_12005 [Pyrinomonadaceae bacterium]|nr:hypothetical protein [Pyrinomonadaceae bacterium]
MIYRLSLFLVLSLSWITVFAQGEASSATPAASGATTATAIVINATTTPIDLARAAFNAHGGEKFRTVKSMILRGSVDLYAPNSTQPRPGGFIIVTAGEKARVEIDASPIIAFKQIDDGQRSYSSLPNVELPPLGRFGMAVLAKFDQPGYKVTAVPDKKKHRAFRISDADGYATEFYIDPATGRVMSFLINYQGYVFGTEHKKFKEVEGVVIPSNFSQRLEMLQGAFFADYNVKDIKLNNPLGDDVFAIP